MSRFLIACGGTGGHLAPGIAIAQRLIRKGHTCRLVISHKRVDTQLIQKYPELEFVAAPGSPFSWRPVGLLRFFVGQVRNTIFGWRLIRSFRPDLILGFGGFVSVGLGLTGRLLKIPLALHEANRRPGKAIRLLARFADRIYLPRGVRMDLAGYQRVRESGFPLRQEIQHMPLSQARIALGLPREGKLLLILGGSQGAQALNQWVEANFDKLANHGVHVLCVTGLNKGTARVDKLSGPRGEEVEAHFVPFSDRMCEVLNSADLAVARAGAGTIAELIRCRVPSILVPYPYASDNHQLANARYLEQMGASVTVEEERLDSLFDEVNDLIFNDWLLTQFRENLERLDQDAVGEITGDLLSLLGEPERKAPVAPKGTEGGGA